MGAAAEVVSGVDPKRKGSGEPLESRLNLTGDWRKRGRRSLSNRACLPGRSSNAAARVDRPGVHRLGWMWLATYGAKPAPDSLDRADFPRLTRA